ncbi:MAG TPA: hypothetical protein VFI95_21885 [Terriglobales bacterium]|nr:hypothetical protein [Terriglobales bacterium]
MEQRGSVSAFGQADPTDNRERYDWKSRYDDSTAKKGIRGEAIYLGILLFGLPIIMAVFWLGYPKHLFHLSDDQYHPLLKYVFAWTSGSLGGVLFDVKWLYHSVARGLWHLDRRLWRIFTPHISGGLSFFFLALVASGGLRIFDGKATDSLSLVMGLGFLVGYFSDSAVAKLTEVAETLFGTIRAKEKHRETDSKSSENKQDRRETNS